MLKNQAVIVDAVRTPMGRRNGRLKDVHPVVLSSLIMLELLDRAGVDGSTVGDVVWGCVSQVGEQGMNIARNAWLTAGLPMEVPATTVDRQCGSSQQAINVAAAMIQSGWCDVVVAGGVESMSRVPMGISVTQGPGEPFPPELLDRYDLVPQGLSAQMVADKYGVSRREMDEFSVTSHLRAAAARNEGRLSTQIMPMTVTVDGAEEQFDWDEGVRPHATYEAVAKLSPAFNLEHGITAGNSSQISDGAAAVLLMSKERAASLGVRARARIVAQQTVGCDPVLMLEGPIPATRAILEKTGLRLDDIGLFEVNEAFAAVPLAWLKATGANPDRLNVNGGAIAIGHPLGASGARLMCDLLNELERRDLRYGLEAICCGGGIGTATVIDRAVD